MTDTQVPIIAWQKRYMTPRECARLQSMDGLKQLPDSPTQAFHALGNAVNSKVVERVVGALLAGTRPKPGVKRRISKKIQRKRTAIK
jgi:DNA (cytosine-5)-methyltransferase 1